MGTEVLQMFLPSFLIIFLCITFFWKWFRKAMRASEYNDIEKTVNYNRLKRINQLFIVLFILFSIMVLIYWLLPDLYYIFIPLDKFDHPIINSIGILLLKVALVWIIVGQLHIDKELYKYSRKSGDLSLMELVYFSERMFLGGLTVMFVGMFVTITNVVGIIAGLVSVLFYYNLVLRHKESL